MDKSRVIIPVLMGGVIMLFVTAVVTIVNVGVPADFFARWMKSWALVWSAATFIAFLSMPLVRRATERIVALLERRA